LNETEGKLVSSGAKNECPVCLLDEPNEAISKSFGEMQSTWLKCGGCGAFFIHPLPTAEQLSEYYRAGYADWQSPGTVSHSYRFSETNKETIFREYRLSLSDIHVSKEMLLHKRILDYGCANGFFLDFCVTQGCLKEDLFGFDIAEDLLTRVAQKGYHILDVTHRHFDYIFLWDVLEHIPGPGKLLQELKTYLKPGGTVVVQTPRIGLLSDSLQEAWEHFLPFEHVVLHTRKSLIRLFEQAGFRMVSVCSFGANAPVGVVPEPYKTAVDRMAKETDNGSTQVARFTLEDVS
jgi:2-polyprenyl-3-methyl-5-hydroxy-6-metoxy-1,4-benzoquinol methylase